MKPSIHIVILAAGEGKRMKSDLPKTLHPVGGRPTLLRIIEAAIPLSPNLVIVVGNKSDVVTNALGNGGGHYCYAIQTEQRGTGHAVLAAKDALREMREGDALIVLPGDHPLIATKTLAELAAQHRERGSKITVGTLALADFENDRNLFSHNGRIKRNAAGEIDAIIETKDAGEEEKMISEVNAGFYCFDAVWLFEHLPRLEANDVPKNAAGEIYLTDLVSLARRAGAVVHAYQVQDPRAAMGFNTPEELAAIKQRFERHLGQELDK